MCTGLVLLTVVLRVACVFAAKQSKAKQSTAVCVCTYVPYMPPPQVKASKSSVTAAVW